jgi:agmatine deiminase
MPAEWEPHAATWLAWPHYRADWPGRMGGVASAFGEMMRRIVPGERVRLIVGSARQERTARAIFKRIGVDPARIDWFAWPTDRAWLRDSGPIFVQATQPGPDAAAPRAIARFHFNGWARFRKCRLDNKIPERVAEALGVPLLPVGQGRRREVILEGGAIDGNGQGTLLTTEECLLDETTQPRNPGLGRKGIERMLRAVLGARNVIWLARGISGDETHGHVDDFCRFVGPRTIVLCRQDRSDDPDHRALEENRERLEDARLEDGSKPQIVRLPMPQPLVIAGLRMAASYANFYIANAAVLVPTFNDPHDRLALGLLAELIPDRPVIGMHGNDLVLGGGTMHCLTQQEPAADA